MQIYDPQKHDAVFIKQYRCRASVSITTCNRSIVKYISAKVVCLIQTRSLLIMTSFAIICLTITNQMISNSMKQMNKLAITISCID